MASLPRYLQLLLPIVESDLRTILRSPETSPPLLYRMLHYHMGWVDADGQPGEYTGGKCIRPVLCLLVSEGVCGDCHPARPAASAVELIHNFSLLHDDIEDRSPLRRNRPTVWHIWGEAQAINAGDTLFALAHLAIPRLAPPHTGPGTIASLLEILDNTALELTGGQHLDISFESRREIGTGEYLDMITGKTAALLAAAAHMGALAGGADDSAQLLYRDFGRNLGMAFQVLDDVLDIWGDPALTGKEAAIDIRQRKKSLPVLYALERDEELRERYASPQPFDDRTVARVIALLDAAGARAYAEELARQYSTRTLSYLESAAPQGDAVPCACGSVARLSLRNYNEERSLLA
jgi:geranylgeranyl diphosphate synthase type I